MSRGEHSVKQTDNLIGAKVCHVLTLNPVEKAWHKAFTEYMITPKSLCGFRDLRSVEMMSRSGLGPIRVHYKNWADQGHSVGYPTVDDTIDESRLEAHLCNPPSGLIGNSPYSIFANTEE